MMVLFPLHISKGPGKPLPATLWALAGTPQGALWVLAGTSQCHWDPGAGSQQADILSTLDPERPFPLPFVRIHSTSAKYEWLLHWQSEQSQKEITNLNSNSFP